MYSVYLSIVKHAVMWTLQLIVTSHPPQLGWMSKQVMYGQCIQHTLSHWQLRVWLYMTMPVSAWFDDGDCSMELVGMKKGIRSFWVHFIPLPSSDSHVCIYRSRHLTTAHEFLREVTWEYSNIASNAGVIATARCTYTGCHHTCMYQSPKTLHYIV